MAVSGVRVNINDATVISALNTPGGEVYEWRNKVEAKLLFEVFEDSPVNDVANALHRKAPVGEFQRSWVTRRQGNGHRLGFQIENFADHAIYVEEGRSASTKPQRFSWAAWGGEIGWVGSPLPKGAVSWGRGTSARLGYHILRDATNRVLAAATGGAYTPLV
jgi:hypothetical protein